MALLHWIANLGTAGGLAAVPFQYTDWITRDNRINWYGAQANLRRPFSGWVQHSGSVYKTLWPTDGKVLEITAVKANGVSLTQGSSDALSAGQFWHKRSVKPNELYTRMPDSSNPHSKKVIGYFTDRYASGVPLGKISNDLNDVPWSARIIPSSVPIISHSMGNVIYGTAVKGSITISFANADGYFDNTKDWLWKGSIWQFVHGDGGPELSYAQHAKYSYVCVGVGSYNKREFTLTFESNLTVLDKPVLQQVFSFDTYPNMDPALEGKPIPEFFGEDTIPFYCIDTQIGKFKGSTKVLNDIKSVKIHDIEVDYTEDLANSELTVDVINVTGVTATPKSGGDLASDTYYVRVAGLINKSA